jgi:hypothetical protein
VKPNVPGVVGVPEIITVVFPVIADVFPVVPKCKPGGRRLLRDREKKMGAYPPVALMVAL